MKKFQNMSIQKKISCLFLGCFLILLICIVEVLFHVYKRQIYQEMLQRGHYEDALIVRQMELLSQNVESCSNNVIINLNLTLGNSDNRIKVPEEYTIKDQEKIMAVLDNNFILFPDVDEISILYENGDLYSKERNRSFTYTQGNTDMLEEFSGWGIDTRGIWHYREKQSPMAYFVKVFRDIEENSKIGYILVKLNEKVIFQNYKNQKADNPSEIYIFDENGILLSSSKRTLLKKIYDESEYEKRKVLSDQVYRELSTSENKDNYIREYQLDKGWRIVSVLDIKAGMRGITVIMKYVVSVSIALMILLLCVTLFILKKIMSPMVTLARHMRETGEYPLQKLEERASEDEAGVLISSFNQMADMNGKLLKRVAQNEKEKRHLELALIQAQIKPHFLYNTLDTAFCLNSMKMHKEANHVIKQLARYYRLILNHGDEWISLAEELDAVEKYLNIQSVRYSDLMTYNISVDEELYEFRIPKLTLQPIVENAIYHGIKPSGKKGNILISGELCGDEVVISITDDGVGMTQEMFEQILSGERKTTDQESFGVKSVVERLRLFYGGKAKIELSPVPIGTSIILTINLRKDENSEISGTAGR